ncbi:MAG: hypothetical protein Q9M19_05300 [Mariprofundaceae bacterium]|nr:hypothetical protein [Mariprofundaceae bacterium]
MKTVFQDKSLLYHHLEWMLAHPRFGFCMIALIALSFTHDRVLASILFVIFFAEISLRFLIMRRKAITAPYRSSLNQRVDILLLVLDIIGVASLLITIFDMPFMAENAAAVRMLRAVYLLRTLRVFRYLDLQSAMYSPTYGMFISLVILISFFATDTLLWVIIIFFLVELCLRYLVMKNMAYETDSERISEWFFWWLDLIATIAMVPIFGNTNIGSILRMLRLIRLFRPWMVIIRNLRDVMREGQFFQEINLIVLILAVLSIGGGVLAHLFLGEFDFTQDKIINAQDGEILAPIWFAFRLFTDPGNAVLFPQSFGLTVFSIVAVIIGVFVFAFFIGIGANIVSGLMIKLRNERLVMTNHMVMLGWSSAAPFIIRQLKTISDRSFTRLKLVLLHNADETPAEVIDEKWLTYRQGSFERLEDLRRVNLAAAQQGLVMMPPANGAKSLAHAFFSLLAIRKVNPELYLSYAIPGMAAPHLEQHEHMLQVGWDKSKRFNFPTVIISEADFRANALCNILRFSDFDQIMNRLMIPDRPEESAMVISEWSGKLVRGEDEQWMLTSPDLKQQMNIQQLTCALFSKGVTFIGIVDEQGKTKPVYGLDDIFKAEVQLQGVIGIAVDQHQLHGEIMTMLNHQTPPTPANASGSLSSHGLVEVEAADTLNLLVIGWVGSLPLLLKRLLRFYHEMTLTILDDLPDSEVLSQQNYLQRRLAEEPGLDELVTIRIQRWDFSDMNALAPYLNECDRVILSRPLHMEEDAYAVIATTLSHIITIVEDADKRPQVFPVLEERSQVRLLQQELEHDVLKTEVHMTVPNEFYGAYVAHTSFNMYTSESESMYKINRALRHALDQLMIDFGDSDQMNIKILKVHQALPESADDLFAMLLEQGYLWIGFRLNSAFEWKDPVQTAVHMLFPHHEDFSCVRQNQIIINPFGNPVSRRSWLDRRDDIVELITIGMDDDVELF